MMERDGGLPSSYIWNTVQYSGHRITGMLVVYTVDTVFKVIKMLKKVKPQVIINKTDCAFALAYWVKIQLLFTWDGGGGLVWCETITLLKSWRNGTSPEMMGRVFHLIKLERKPERVCKLGKVISTLWMWAQKSLLRFGGREGGG